MVARMVLNASSPSRCQAVGSTRSGRLHGARATGGWLDWSSVLSLLSGWAAAVTGAGAGAGGGGEVARPVRVGPDRGLDGGAAGGWVGGAGVGVSISEAGGSSSARLTPEESGSRRPRIRATETRRRASVPDILSSIIGGARSVADGHGGWQAPAAPSRA